MYQCIPWGPRSSFIPTASIVNCTGVLGYSTKATIIFALFTWDRNKKRQTYWLSYRGPLQASPACPLTNPLFSARGLILSLEWGTWCLTTFYAFLPLWRSPTTWHPTVDRSCATFKSHPSSQCYRHLTIFHNLTLRPWFPRGPNAMNYIQKE